MWRSVSPQFLSNKNGATHSTKPPRQQRQTHHPNKKRNHHPNKKRSDPLNKAPLANKDRTTIPTKHETTISTKKRSPEWDSVCAYLRGWD